MREDYYADYYEFENNNWWFVSRRRILCALLRKYMPAVDAPRRMILDAGCGTGINLAMLDEFGGVRGVDMSEEAIRFCRERNENNVRQADLRALPFDDSQFDLTTALDVLEHIQEDEKAFAEIARVCKPEGYFLLTVPVFPSLWGEHDVINQHVRRYEPSRIFQLLEQNGFSVVHRSYMNTWLLPAAFAWRWIAKLMRYFEKPGERPARADNMHHHPFFNWILTAVFSSEAPIILGPGMPFGLSLAVLAVKREKEK